MSNKKIKKPLFKRRIRFAAFLFLASITFLMSKVLYIKLVKGKEYESIAIGQQISKFDNVINPNRGSILDRNQQFLAYSETVFNVIYDPIIVFELVKDSKDEKGIKEQDKTVNTLVKLLDLKEADLREHIAVGIDGKPKTNSHYVELAKKIDKNLAKKIDDAKLKGVFLIEDTKRFYPNDSLASHTIGFLMSEAWGLERQYNEEMIGQAGRMFINYDKSNNPVTQYIQPVQGKSIVTTLDFNIQQIAETVVEKYFKMYNPENITVIASKPKTGEILALVNYPNFNVNDPSEISSYSKSELKQMDDELGSEILFKTWKNFAISETFEPGSTYKPMVVAAALEEGVVTENSSYFCDGYKQVADRKIMCANIYGHGSQNLEEVLANSCNVGMIEIIQSLGKEKYYKYQEEFGIGKLTGIDLPGEESAESLIYSLDEINEVELATHSMGQTFNATSMQMIVAFNAVINDGKLMKPHILSQIINEKNEVEYENKPEELRQVISKNTSKILKKHLQSVIEVGTGKLAGVKAYSLGGKTGTAEQGADRKGRTLSFIGYLSGDDPEISLFITIHKPESVGVFGSTAAAPMFKEIMEGIISYLSISPDKDGEDVDISLDSEMETVEVGDYEGMTLIETSRAIINAGLKFEVSGVGNLVTGQTIKAATKVKIGSTITLYLDEDEKGTEVKFIPDVRGVDFSEASEILSSYGIEVSFEGSQDGVVITQDPQGGTYEESGVIVHLSLGREAEE